MGVVSPYNQLGSVASLAAEVVGEGVEGVGHVLVAEVPRRDLCAEHCPVVLFGVPNYPGVLLGVEELILGHQSITAGVLKGVVLQVDELLDCLPLAGIARPEGGGGAVGLAFAAVVIEARVALPGS